LRKQRWARWLHHLSVRGIADWSAYHGQPHLYLIVHWTRLTALSCSSFETASRTSCYLLNVRFQLLMALMNWTLPMRTCHPYSLQGPVWPPLSRWLMSSLRFWEHANSHCLFLWH
jgi:hypothetical protein